MIPRDKRQAPQRDLLETYLEDILNPRHELVQMGKRIDWTACEQHFGRLYAVEAGRPGLPIRLRVGLQLLNHTYALSDRDVLDRWVENPYWQHFCGEVIFQHRLTMDETTMMRLRHRIGEDGARELLKMSIALGKDTGVIAPESLKVAVIDTTVMPKAIAYLSDARLADRGYRGSESTFLSKIHITGKRRGRGKAHPDQQHRRNSIEPIIGHLKSDGLMFWNFLRGLAGDKTHAVLCGVGLNLRKVLRKLAELLWPYENGRYLRLILAILWSTPALPDESTETGDLLVI